VRHAQCHLSPCGRGRIASIDAIRVRGYGLTIDREPSPQPSPTRWRGEFAACRCRDTEPSIRGSDARSATTNPPPWRSSRPASSSSSSNRAHHRRRGFGHPYEIVEQYGSWPQQTCDARAVAGIGLMRQRIIVRFAQLDRPPHDRLSTASMTSAAHVISVAPCLMRSLVPAARGSSGEPRQPANDPRGPVRSRNPRRDQASPDAQVCLHHDERRRAAPEI